MPVALVVHVAGRHGVAGLDTVGATGRVRWRTATRTVGPPADLIVFHGRRAGCRAMAHPNPTALQLYRPAPGTTPGGVDVAIGRHMDLVVARDEQSATTYRTRLHRGAGSVLVLTEDHNEAWRSLVERLVEPEPTEPAPTPSAPRIAVATVAVREVGPDLLVAAPGPFRAVERLTGPGSVIWRLLADGQSVEQITDALTHEGGSPREIIAADVEAFVADLERSGLVVRS